MKTAEIRWRVRDKRQLLMRVMQRLAGAAHISFEGNLHNLKLSALPGSSPSETTVLKRNTMWPTQDFVVLALEQSGAEGIITAMGGVVPRSILHIQIERDGVIEFGAYDQFDPESVFFGPALEGSFTDSLGLRWSD